MKLKLIPFLYVSASLLIACGDSIDTRHEFHPNGHLKSSIETKNGVRHGLSRSYYQDGNIEEETSWTSGRKDGESKYYDRTGQLKEYHNYKGRKVNGKSLLYYSDGKIQEERIFDAGKLLDVRSYLNSGKRNYEHRFPIAYLSKDTMEIGEKCRFFMKLVNADSTIYKEGMLIITNKFRDNGDPIDTIFSTISSNQRGFEYSFNINQAGQSFILGQLIFRRKLNNETVDEVYEFKKEYFVHTNE